MINEEQRELSEYIKSVHLSLRRKSQKVGAETAWKQHIENEEILKNYAIRMKTLAENYWSVNNRVADEKCLCRIQWITQTVRQYFEDDGLLKELSRENEKLKYFIHKSLLKENEVSHYLNNPYKNFEKPYIVLDVGSCYDPFAAYDFLTTFSIDLYPAVPTVKKCDFTQLDVINFSPKSRQSWFCDNLRILPQNFFDVVVFSLFLEYLPSPSQRYKSCQKAYQTLKVNGLLLIATPDSKHESANSSLMKKWKFSLAKIGFVRVKFEKLKYVYCMAYRKSSVIMYPILLYNVKDTEENNLIPIPQDSIDYLRTETTSENKEIDDKWIMEAFEELPFLDGVIDA